MSVKNQITLIGNLTGKPELKSSRSGVNYTNFTIAINMNSDKTLFFDCSAFNKTAEIITKFTDKGDRVVIQGSLDYSETSPDGKNKTRYYKILVDDIVLDQKKKSDDLDLDQRKK